jgi:hypothetical protein
MKLTTHDDDEDGYDGYDDDDNNNNNNNNNLIPRFTIHGNIPPHPQMLSLHDAY